jgi:phosphate starvation-inducible protein PhoH
MLGTGPWRDGGRITMVGQGFAPGVVRFRWAFVNWQDRVRHHSVQDIVLARDKKMQRQKADPAKIRFP